MDTLAGITQVLTAREELAVAIESGYLSREDAAAELDLYDRVLAAF